MKTWCWCGGFPFSLILFFTVVLHPGRYTHTLTHCTLSVRLCVQSILDARVCEREREREVGSEEEEPM